MQTDDAPRYLRLIWLAGVLAAVLMVDLLVPVIAYPLGSDWGHYFTIAEFLWHPSESLAYPDFRKPFFGIVLGALGERMGYLEAAQLIGRMSAMVVVLSAGIAGRALVGPWTGVASAWTVLWLPLVMRGALWVNHYPLLGASMALALASGLAACRWGGLRWAVLAGLSAGAAMALDIRGGLALPMVALLVCLGGFGQGVRRWGLMMALFGAGAGGLHLHDEWTQTQFNVPQLEFGQQLQVQRKGVLEQIRAGNFADMDLETACADLVVGPFDLKSATNSCATALRSNSYRRLVTERMLPGPIWFMLIPLLLLPMGWAGFRGYLRSSIAAAVTVGFPAAAILTGMGWVTYFDRYLLPFGMVFALVVPVALGRAIALGGIMVPRLQPILQLCGATAAMAFAWLVWPGTTPQDEPDPLRARGSEYHAGVFAAWSQAHREEGDSVVDCAGLAIDSLLLPQRIDYVRFPPGDDACAALIRDPGRHSGRIYLITMHRDLPENTTVHHLTFDRAGIAALGWAPVDLEAEVEGYQLWRKESQGR